MEHTEKMPVQPCVNCGWELNSDTSIDQEKPNEVPKENDLCICLFCGMPYYFNEQLQKVPLSEKQYRAMPMQAKDILKEAWRVRMEVMREAQRQNIKFSRH